MASKVFTLDALDEAATIEVKDRFAGQVTLQLVDGGSWNGTITFEGTVNGSTWVAIQARNLNSGSDVTTTTAAGLFRIDASGLTNVRARASTVTAGSMLVVAAPVMG